MYFLLSSTVPTSAPQNTVGTAPTSRSITLQWDPPPIEDQNGIIVLYQIDVIEVESGMLFQYIFSGTFIFIPNLHPYYTYQWVVSASTTVGYGPDTEPSIVTTPEDGKCSDCRFGAQNCTTLCIIMVMI